MPSDAKKRQAARKKEEARQRLKKKPQSQAQQQQNGVDIDDDDEQIRNEVLQNGHIPVVSETDEELKGDAGSQNGKGRKSSRKT